ncbi:DUF3500 domain-containing protein [Fuerstiella marisgermanici]|uniref:DUF3500 domain-containing protein n=1 Tax=Fuerstiella marisgermanici TaxID=1891926 RepID=A0A1P8W9K9_9PLAN|nr:DUF3500 domain-containing protein [Fuerstiella marisgermanici]APZ90753.1 hypothetical protein Fuma_00337 [Fuerstiella marisgermanici]
MKLVISLIVLAMCGAPAFAQNAATAEAVVGDAVKAANAFLGTLNAAQVEKVQYSFTDEKQRHNWSNLPVQMVPRGGLRWGDLNQTQKDALTALLKASLSDSGYQQIIDNMDGDEVLKRESDGRRRTMFGRDEYFVSFLGKPSTEEPWMLQFGGHHLAFNVTFVGAQMTISPSLTGGQPVDYTLDGRTVRQLAAEEDKSFKVIAALKPAQLKTARLGDRYTDMRYGPGKEGAQPQQEGINAGSLEPQQQKLLLELMGERLGLLKEPFAKQRMERIESDLDQTWFSWYGDVKDGGAATFRVQGPTILMEYSPQKLGGRPTNHIHAMYRAPTNDYGLGFLKK